MSGSWSDKKVGELVDFSLEWKYRLNKGETISTSSWTVTGNLVISANTFGESKSTIWVANGTPGYANLTNTIVTSEGRRYIETRLLKII